MQSMQRMVVCVALGMGLVGFAATGVGAADPHVFVWDGSTLRVSDAVTLAPVADLAGAIGSFGGFDDGRHMVIDSLGGRVFVSNGSNFDVYDFSLSQCLPRPFQISEPLGMAPLPNGKLLVTSEENSNPLFRMNADLSQDAQSSGGSFDGAEGVAFDSVHNRAFVADEDDEDIEIFNGSTLAHIATESFSCNSDGPYWLGVDGSSNRLFVLADGQCPGFNPATNNFGIHVFDIGAGGDSVTFDQTLFGSGGGGSNCYGALTVSEDANRLFAIDFCSDTVDIYDTTNLNFLGSVATARAGTTPLMVSVGELGLTAALGTSLLQPAGTLIMPFDNTTNHASFDAVTRPAATTGPGPIATHWSYWSEDCRHLVDVVVCLTPGDTKVMDPGAVQGEIQSPNPPSNNPIGSLTDLTGERGMVTVTAFEASTGPSGVECSVLDPEATLDNEIVGGWTIADTVTNAAFGGDAVGVASGALPGASFLDDGLGVLTFNPQTLGDSEVIVLSLEISKDSGNGVFQGSEIGPIPRALPDGHRVCCNVTHTDNLEVRTSLPDLCLNCVGFNPISDLQAESGEVSVIPPTTTINAPGLIELTQCVAADDGGEVAPIGAAFDQFLFAWHGQAIGPFGAAFQAKYQGVGTGALRGCR